jgi:sporulation protein YabP
MDKNKEIINNAHSVQISERKTSFLTGIKKIESFDSNEFFIESIMGYILVKGEGLELVKLDTFQGNLSIKGKIDSLIYLEEGNKKVKTESILSKLFK